MVRLFEEPDEDDDGYFDHPASPEVWVEDRDPDLVLYGPDGGVLIRIVDRPFRGFRSSKI